MTRKIILTLGLCLLTSAALQAAEPARFTKPYIKRVTELALGCIHTEYPNILSYLKEKNIKSTYFSDTPFSGDSYKQQAPAFYGCFDWHSSVHNHWALVRILRLSANPEQQSQIIDTLNSSFTPENIATEVASFQSPEMHRGYELPYGFTWFLQLTGELRQWDNLQARQWLANLKPLEDLIVERLQIWLASMNTPLIIGTHNNTAFNLGLMLDWAKVSDNSHIARRIEWFTKKHYGKKASCPIASEPERKDFLSPCLAEADLMRRVLTTAEFDKWFSDFLPTVPLNGKAGWLSVQLSAGEDTHLFGLNLTRAWMLDGIAQALPEKDPRIATLNAESKAHQEAGTGIVLGELNYMASHWLGSFTAYLLTERGVSIEN
ncbi:DUF2891 domain-containing protein [Porticoccaceae bacterium LTM1]|nr:DUF2891 domain-containing protein [Porticoccaceae bacterium LTM1]